MEKLKDEIKDMNNNMSELIVKMVLVEENGYYYNSPNQNTVSTEN